MQYERQTPSLALQHLIECYWLIDSEGESSIDTQKIIPDGYPETILHYKSAYEINIDGQWHLQPKLLLAGQIKNHFFLRNTGESGMIGIKWQPAALSVLFGLDMSTITNKIVELPNDMISLFKPFMTENGISIPENPLTILDSYLADEFKNRECNTLSNNAIDTIIERKGLITINELITLLSCSERQLERSFKNAVGLSPKFYCRVIRLGRIFELMQEGNKDWGDLVYHSGFYDQPHFIKNFKEFTGEDPSSYGFDERNMANFHLKK